MNHLRIKAPFRFQLHGYKKVFAIMYLCLFAIFALTEIAILVPRSNATVTFSNMEAGSIITIFITALFSYKESFRFIMANSITRKSHFASSVLALATLSAAFSLVNTILSTVYSFFTNYRPLFVGIYAGRFGLPEITEYPLPSLQLTFQMQLENFLWSIFFHLLFAMAGFLIAVSFYRMNKWVKIAVLVGVPTVLLNGVEALDFYFLNGKISAFFRWFGPFLFGGSNYQNPYFSILNMLLFSALIAALAWLLARRAVLKRN